MQAAAWAHRLTRTRTRTQTQTALPAWYDASFSRVRSASLSLRSSRASSANAWLLSLCRAKSSGSSHNPLPPSVGCLSRAW